MKLEDILQPYGDSCLDYRSVDGKIGVVPVADMWKADYTITAGNNRHLDVRRIGASELIKSRMINKDQSLSTALQWNNVHCDPPLEEDDVKAGFYKYSIPFTEKMLRKRAEEKAKLERMQQETRENQKIEILNTATKATLQRPSSPLLKGYNDDFFEYLIDLAGKTVKQEDVLLRQINYTTLSN